MERRLELCGIREDFAFGLDGQETIVLIVWHDHQTMDVWLRSLMGQYEANGSRELLIDPPGWLVLTDVNPQSGAKPCKFRDYPQLLPKSTRNLFT